MPFENDSMRVLMSSENTEWETPPELFNPINELFEFDMDVCAFDSTTKIPGNFISPEQDAFKTEWDGVCWMNPPYAKPEKKCKVLCDKKRCKTRGFHVLQDVPGLIDWIDRAIEQSKKPGVTVVCLVPARTDTEWFQKVFTNAQMIVFLRGRWKFVGADSGATFPSCIAVFGQDRPEDFIFEGMSDLGNVIDPKEGGILVYSGK